MALVSCANFGWFLFSVREFRARKISERDFGEFFFLSAASLLNSLYMNCSHWASLSGGMCARMHLGGKTIQLFFAVVSRMSFEIISPAEFTSAYDISLVLELATDHFLWICSLQLKLIRSNHCVSWLWCTMLRAPWCVLFEMRPVVATLLQCAFPFYWIFP